MTNQQKTAIANLMNSGLGYSRVAQQLGMNENTVKKAYCRRNGLKRAVQPAIDPQTGLLINGCRNCGKIVSRFVSLVSSFPFITPLSKRPALCCERSEPTTLQCGLMRVWGTKSPSSGHGDRLPVAIQLPMRNLLLYLDRIRMGA